MLSVAHAVSIGVEGTAEMHFIPAGFGFLSWTVFRSLCFAKNRALAKTTTRFRFWFYWVLLVAGGVMWGLKSENVYSGSANIFAVFEVLWLVMFLWDRIDMMNYVQTYYSSRATNPEIPYRNVWSGDNSPLRVPHRVNK
jgi:hypothetical protein